MPKLLPLLQLMRPANIVTAIADILLGVAASGIAIGLLPWQLEGTHLADLSWLIVATIGLYGGGVVMNDVFDTELDRIERPERPIPSGRVSHKAATVLGILLLTIGLVGAGMVSSTSIALAGAISFAAVWYDAYGKHHSFWGPLNMGLCRGLNLLLGMSIGTLGAMALWLPLIPILYISAITIISRGEVHGTGKEKLYLGIGLYGIVFAMILIFSGNKMHCLPFLLLFGGAVLPPLFKALQSLQPKDIGKAVKAGVLALILMDAALAAGLAGWQYGLVIVILLPISLFLARFFAVT